MENKFTEEMIAKAKQAKTVDELEALAKEAGVVMTREQLEKAFDELHPKAGELTDDELDDVAGGCGEKENEWFCVRCGASKDTLLSVDQFMDFTFKKPVLLCANCIQNMNATIKHGSDIDYARDFPYMK